MISALLATAVVRLMVNVSLGPQNLGIEFIPGMNLEILCNSHFTQEEIEKQIG